METLVKRAQKGDAEAFISLIEENKMSLQRIAFGYLGNDEDVADAMQDTILNAFEHISTLKKSWYFRTWLVRILINNCTRIYRQSRKHIGFDEQVEMAACQMDCADIEFQELLRSLPEDSRIIFQLYFGEQFTTKEIAAILDIKENTVKSKIHRGKKQLFEELQNGR